MQCTVSEEVYGEEVWKINSACYCTNRQISGIRVATQVFSFNSFDLFVVISVTRMKQLDYCKIEEKLKKLMFQVKAIEQAPENFGKYLSLFLKSCRSVTLLKRRI